MFSNTEYQTHHKLHAWRIFWLFFLVGGLLAIQVAYNLQSNQSFHVLAYSTNVNRGDLHSLTNAERSANGLPGLQLNSTLNQAAQGKAEHMINNNYWAHTAPDGTTPWYWFDWAGYPYVRAGENLAYGFADSYGVIQGWMNSPGHRANVLGDYRDVGFGYASGPNYQGGPNTVVVAMYGTSRNSPPPPPPAPAVAASPTPPAPSPPAPVEVPVAPAEPAPVPETAVPPADTNEEIPVPALTNSENPQPSDVRETNVAQPRRVTTVEQALSGSAAWPLYASIAVIIISTAGFSMTHLRMIRHSWNNGVRFAVHHPLLDAAVVSSIALFFFSTTIGYIR